MPLIGGEIGYRLLCLICPPRKMGDGGDPYESSQEKLLTHFGEQFLEDIQGKTVLDFGCGTGEIAVELASLGAERVIGIEIREELHEVARSHARERGVEGVCTFATHFSPEEHGAVAYALSLDSFEHFDDPGGILDLVSGTLARNGEMLISFGWPWYHPYGGHLFSVFPWAHLIFTEAALIRWRSDFKDDGATRFCEVAGGLNQMTIQRMEDLVKMRSLTVDTLRLTPIRPLRWVHCRATREFTTALIFARLKRNATHVPERQSASVSARC